MIQSKSLVRIPPGGEAIRGLIADIDHFAVHDGPGIRTAVYLKGCPLHCDWCHSPETQSFAPELVYLAQKCTACGLCLDACTRGALSAQEIAPGVAQETQSCLVAVDWERCTQCGDCAAVCYPGALKMVGTWMAAADLAAQVEKDIPFFSASGGGVTLTGGEATAQPVFTRAFLASCKALGIHTALETNGCAPWRVYEDLIEVVDLFLFDLKHMNETSHRRFTGISNRQILNNLRRLAEKGVEVIVRVPCIPGINDSLENITATAEFIREVGLRAIHLLPYNSAAGAKYRWIGRQYTLPEQSTQGSEKMEELAAICRVHGLAVQVEN